MKILISTSSFAKDSDEPLNILKNNLKDSDEIILNPHHRKLTPEETKELLKDIDGLIAGTEKLNKEVLAQANNLKVISRCGAGMDNVDVDFAKEKGIKVFRTPQAPALAVAELTLGLMLDSLRYITFMDKLIRSDRWDKKMGRLLSEKTIGIVGMGSIGKTLIKLLKPFNCKILAYDITPDNNFAEENKILYTDIKNLLMQCDIISVHLSLSAETKNFFNEEKFNLMKKDAVFINTSRGEVVDETALYNSLKENKISFAALDVYNEEPYKGKLKELSNVILSCHVGSYAKEARIKMEIEAVHNLLEGLKKK